MACFFVFIGTVFKKRIYRSPNKLITQVSELYEEVDDPALGLAVAKKNKLIGYINKQFEWETTLKYVDSSSYICSE